MTINEEVPIHIYTGNGTATEFSYTFTIFDETDIVLTLLTIATDVETTITTDYSINDTLKKVTYPVSGSPLTSAYKLVISRNVPDEQDINFTSAGAFNTTNITNSFDKVTMNIQELKESISRCVKWKISTDPITTTDAEDFLGGSGTVSGSTTWGDITGTLSEQTDLQDALNLKSNTDHDHSSTYSAIDHNHSSTYSDISHNHSSTYSNKVSSSTTGNFVTFTDASGTIGNSTYNSSSFASSTHDSDHSGTYQALNTNLTALSNITLAGDVLLYATASDTMASTTFTATARTLLDDPTTLSMRDTLGVSALNGFENKTSSALAMSGSDFQITTATNYNIWSNGTKYNKATTQSVAITNDNTQHFVYFNTSGVLTVSTSAWDILSDNVHVATVYKTASNYAIFNERHGYDTPRSWHDWAHDTVGTRYESGGTGTFTNTTLSILRCYVHDEDNEIDTGGTKAACRLWYRNSGAASMTFESNISTPYKADAGVIQFDSAGTLTNVQDAKFVCSYVYVTNDIDYPIAVVVGQNEYTTIANARLESLPTIPNLPVMEWKLIYRVIYKNVSGTPTYQEAADYRNSASLPSGGSASTNASNVLTSTGAFSGNVLTSSDSTVQSALDTLDSYLNDRKYRAIYLTVGDGTTVPSADSKGFLKFNIAGTITSWDMTADVSGSAVIDIKRNGTSIIGAGNKPTLNAEQTATAAVSSWTSTVIASGDKLEFVVDSAATVTRINLMVAVTV